jgi:hypothetical protein
MDMSVLCHLTDVSVRILPICANSRHHLAGLAKDKEGVSYDGEKTYRLNVPPILLTLVVFDLLSGIAPASAELLPVPQNLVALDRASNCFSMQRQGGRISPSVRSS